MTNPRMDLGALFDARMKTDFDDRRGPLSHARAYPEGRDGTGPIRLPETCA